MPLRVRFERLLIVAQVFDVRELNALNEIIGNEHNILCRVRLISEKNRFVRSRLVL